MAPSETAVEPTSAQIQTENNRQRHTWLELAIELIGPMDRKQLKIRLNNITVKEQGWRITGSVVTKQNNMLQKVFINKYSSLTFEYRGGNLS